VYSKAQRKGHERIGEVWKTIPRAALPIVLEIAF
jgi:hypothetical protein